MSIASIVSEFEAYVSGQRYVARVVNSAPKTDEIVITAIDLDRGTGSAIRRVGTDGVMFAIALFTAWQECCAELDDRRAHADTAQQPSTLDAAADFDPIQASYDSFRLDVAKAVVEAAKPKPRIDLAKLTKEQASPVFTTKKTSYATFMFSAEEIAQANASARKLYDAISAETDEYLAEMAELDARYLGTTTADLGPPADPLDVKYDGVTLRDLLKWDVARRRDDGGCERRWGGAPTPAQRSAISAHWSAELRAKVAATKQKEREQVVCERDEDGL